MNSTRGQLFLLATAFLVSTRLMLGQTTITIVHVNDTHSHLDAFGPKDFREEGTIGGIAKAASIIGAVRAKEKNVILLHGGDAFVGDFFFNKYFGIPELQLMSGLGFDAMAVGNHEFDLGPDLLTLALTSAAPTFPLLSANLDMSGYPALQPLIKSSVMIERSGVKIGIFGMTVPDLPTMNAAPVKVLEDVGGIAYQMAGGLRAAGADIVVCLSHMGYLYDQAVAANVPGIDVIVGAHDHYVFEQPVRVTNPGGAQTLILQAGAFYMNVGELRLTVDKGQVRFADYRIIPVDRTVPRVREIQGVVDQLKAGIVQTYGDVYHRIDGFALADMNLLYNEKSSLRDTPMGDLVTDACRWKGDTQLAISALGLINEKIYAGPIVGADVFRAVPYGFDPSTGLGVRLVRLQLEGDSLFMGIETTLSFLGVSEDFFLQVSGMSFTYDATRPVGQRVLPASIRIGGRPLNPASRYTVTVDEALASLLPVMGVSATLLGVMPDNEYTVVRDYIRHRHILAYRPEGRIRDVSVRCGAGERLADGENSYAEGTAEIPAPEIVHEFALNCNYPNPFNPSTTISYVLPAPSRVTLKIYNTIGQEVATLCDGEQSAGTHEVRWDGSGSASGIYFCRMTAGGDKGRGNFSAVRKLTLLK